jgi:hypothetical protein
MRVRIGAAVAAGVALALLGSSARAGELMAGIYDHGIGVSQGREGGVDPLLGYSTDPIGALWWLGKPDVHVIVAANTNVPTDFVAAGFDWKFKLFRSRWYLRPGIGIAYTTGKGQVENPYTPGLSPAQMQHLLHIADTRIEFGDSVLFEPELALGYKFTPKWGAEISYVHLSNGEILHHGQNEALDDIGVRLIYHFGH